MNTFTRLFLTLIVAIMTSACGASIQSGVDQSAALPAATSAVEAAKSVTNDAGSSQTDSRGGSYVEDRDVLGALRKVSCSIPDGEVNGIHTLFGKIEQQMVIADKFRGQRCSSLPTVVFKCPRHGVRCTEISVIKRGVDVQGFTFIHRGFDVQGDGWRLGVMKENGMHGPRRAKKGIHGPEIKLPDSLLKFKCEGADREGQSCGARGEGESDVNRCVRAHTVRSGADKGGYTDDFTAGRNLNQRKRQIDLA